MPIPDLTDSHGEPLDFPRRCHRFLRQLAANNHREWFAENRTAYHATVLDPARAFVRAAGARLARHAPHITADPRANGQGSISRIQRDVRFSADKTPYRTFVGILLWEGGPERKWDSPGFHLVLQPGLAKLSAGIRRFSPAQLVRWREACHDASLRRVLKKIEAADFEVGESHYKLVPRGCAPKSEQHAELLRHRGLTAISEAKIPARIYGEEFLELCIDTWKKMAPLNRWLQQLE